LKLDHISFWHPVATFCKCVIYSIKHVCNGLEPISCVSATKEGRTKELNACLRGHKMYRESLKTSSIYLLQQYIEGMIESVKYVWAISP